MITLYVGNLPFDLSDQQLYDAFARFGNVVSACVAIDRETRRPRGFGFVEMATAAAAQDAVRAMNDSDLFGRRLIVNEARPKNGPRHVTSQAR